MKFGIFTDAHYSSAEITCGCRYNSRSLEKIREAYAYFAEAGCDLILCLGDLTDTETTYEAECANLRSCAAVMDASSIPTVCVMGNHDAFVFDTDEFYRILGEKYRPHPITADGVTLLFLDACHFSDGTHYRPGDSKWTDTFYPYTEALKQELTALDGDVFLFLHQNVDPAVPENHRLSNDAVLRSILAECGNVRAVFQGHYHHGAEHTVDGIRYLTLPALCEHTVQEAVQIITLP